MRTDRLNRPTRWRILALSVITLVATFNVGAMFGRDPEFLWPSFGGLALGVAGAATGAVIAGGIILYRHLRS